MKEIIIKQLSLLNFKGVRDLTIDFDARVTDISGRNGLGKTTIFDAFTWLLFGKDSQDRKKFDLKTLDSSGRIISQLPHEVAAIIAINGEEVRLTRRFTEKWVKRAGETEPVFTGNEEERFYNDVPCSAREYDAKIADICNETVFKFITSPTCFSSQSASAQKQMLFKMAGNITDKEIAAGNEDFEKLLELITGKTLEEFKKEISAKKSRLNDEIADIPGRIDEKKRDLTLIADEDWTALESEREEKREQRAEIEKQLDEAAEAQRESNRLRLADIEELGKLRSQKMQRFNEVTSTATKDYYTRKQNQSKLTFQVSQLHGEIQNHKQAIETAEREIKACAANRERLIAEYQKLYRKSEAIKAETLTFDESEFVCPTCKRPLDIADIEARQVEMTENFEKQRGERLQQVANAIEENQRLGKANNAKRAGYDAQIEKHREDIATAEKQIADIEASPEYSEKLTEPDVRPLLASDSVIAELDNKIQQLEAKTAEETPQIDNADLKAKRNELTAQIESLSSRISKRESRQRAQQRIGELESQYQSLNDEIARLEKLEFTIIEFSKARSEAIERRINGLFSLVKFRWIATAINGAEKETCEATLDGKPYSTCSAGEKIIIGLDIINAISTSQGISAPIFIDNAESLTRELPMTAQIINLRVSYDDKLIIKNGTD